MKIGVIGLGIMGLPIAENIRKKSGETVIGFDVAEAQCEKFKAYGGEIAAPEKIYSDCDLIFFSLPNNKLVDIYFSQAVPACKSGAILVDLSSSLPAIIRKYEAEASEKGIALIDCPLSGGEAGAIAGKLSAMCGGEKKDVDAVMPYLMMFNSKVSHMGKLGCGYVAKFANNMIVGSEIVAVAEAFAYAKKAGLDENVLFEAIRDGACASCVLEVKGPKMLNNDYSASSTLAIHLKDQHNALGLAEEIGAYVPMVAQATEAMEKLMEAGHGADDVAVIYDLFN